jgi:hypothetical protein
MDWKRAVVHGLNSACEAVDEVAYRPAVVRLTLPLPRWWRCELAQLSMWLDERWHLGWWDTSDGRTVAPGGLCDICHRRPANLEVGGSSEDLGVEDDGRYMESHPLRVCFWCQLPSGHIENDEQLAAAIADARTRSISWRWRWHPQPE